MMRYLRFAVLGPLALAALVLVALSGNGGPAEAVPGVTDPVPQQIDNVSIDMDPYGTPANPDNGLLGSIETCKSVPVGGSIDIDIVVDELDPADLLKGLSAHLNYAATGLGAVKVTGVSDDLMLGANAGSVPLGLSDPVPDDNGYFCCDATDLGPVPGSAEQGEGVWCRIQLTGVSAGMSWLTLDGVLAVAAIGPLGGGAIPVNNINAAIVAVGTPCPPFANVEATSVTTTSPATAEVGTSFTVQASDIAVSNNGPEDPVNVDVDIYLNLPSECSTDDPPVHIEDVSLSVPGSPVDLPSQSWSVSCGWSLWNMIHPRTTVSARLDDPGVYDVWPGNDTRISSSMTIITAETDLAVDSITVSDASGGQAVVNVPFVVDSVVSVSNLGSYYTWGDLVVALDLPTDCVAGDPNPQTVEFIDLSPSTPTEVGLSWSVTCSQGFGHLFSASATISARQTGVTDPNGANDTSSGQVVIPVAGDFDVDGVPDPIDNCYYIFNPDQANADGDPYGDACDNCPDVPTPWSVPEGDSDCDGFSDDAEAFVGTDPADACPDTPDPDDEADDKWSADFNDDQTVDILDIVQLTPPVYGSETGDPLYTVRKDLDPNGKIHILDIVKLTPPMFNSSCTP